MSLATVRRGLAVTPQLTDGLALTLGLALVAAGGRVVVPVAAQYALDHDLAPRPVAHAVALGVTAVAVAGLASWTAGRRLIRASEAALASLRVQAFAHVLRTRTPSEHRGTLVARVTDDVDTVAQFTQSAGVTLLANLAQMLAATAVMAFYSPLLAVLVVVLCGPVVALMLTLQRRVAERYALVRRRIGAMSAGVTETVQGAEVLRSHDASDWARERLESRVDAVEQAQRATRWPLHVNTSLGEVANGLITVAVLLVGVLLAIGGLSGLTVGELVAFLFLVTFFVRPLQFSVSALGEAQGALAGWRRVLDLLAVPTDEVLDGERLPAGRADVVLERVGFSYLPGRPVLTDVSVTIPAGAQVAVVGATGSGKTTFAKLLTRQLVPGAGRILVAGVDLASVTDASLARRVAVVPQDAFLFEGTVGENVAMGRPGAGAVEVAAVLERLDLTAWAASLPQGLDTPVGRAGAGLSAGERQLVALARTALVDPDLLILDEATSGLDPATDVRVHRALVKLGHGRTTVTIAHRMLTAQTAELVLVFDAGRLAEAGPHASLVSTGGPYARLHEAWRRREPQPPREPRPAREPEPSREGVPAP